MIRIEIWASGSGTNADAIIEYFTNHPSIEVGCLACNKHHAGAFNVAAKHKVPSVLLTQDDWNEDSLLAALKERKIDFIVLAGFLKLVPAKVTQQYTGRMVNIHPSLLPQYGGKSMYGEHVHRAVLANHEKHTGITIHEVNEEFDKGKILAQYRFPLAASDELLEVKAKIQKVEHKHFAPTIEAWIKSKVNL